VSESCAASGTVTTGPRASTSRGGAARSGVASGAAAGCRNRRQRGREGAASGPGTTSALSTIGAGIGVPTRWLSPSAPSRRRSASLSLLSGSGSVGRSGGHVGR
jgi:hypothetical protein